MSRTDNPFTFTDAIKQEPIEIESHDLDETFWNKPAVLPLVMSGPDLDDNSEDEDEDDECYTTECSGCCNYYDPDTIELALTADGTHVYLCDDCRAWCEEGAHYVEYHWWCNGSDGNCPDCEETVAVIVYRALPDWITEYLVDHGRPEPTTESISQATDKWGIDHTINLPNAMASFYLLEAIANGIPNYSWDDPALTTLKVEASVELERIVRQITPSMVRYLNMAVGGELRHHPTVFRNMLTSNRYYAWGQWYDYCQRFGPTTMLRFAAELFLEFKKDGFGGEPWKHIADTARVHYDGTINDHLFCDRAFHLQHNAGCAFNKIGWGIWSSPDPGNTAEHCVGKLFPFVTSPGLNAMLIIGNAHSDMDTDWSTLHLYAWKTPRLLFRRWWAATNRSRIAIGQRPIHIPIVRKPHALCPQTYVEMRVADLKETI